MCDVSQILMSDRRRLFDGSIKNETKQKLGKTKNRSQEKQIHPPHTTSIKQVNANKLMFNFFVVRVRFVLVTTVAVIDAATQWWLLEFSLVWTLPMHAESSNSMQHILRKYLILHRISVVYA